MLIAKVFDWARASGGFFPVAGQRGIYARPDDHEHEIMSKIKWARVKSLPRTLEKLLRTYNEVNSPLRTLCPLFPPLDKKKDSPLSLSFSQLQDDPSLSQNPSALSLSQNLSHAEPLSLRPSVPPSLPPSLPRSLPPSIHPSIPPSLHPSLPPSLTRPPPPTHPLFPHIRGHSIYIYIYIIV
jgi:hypothetical protein